jgi:hypothetical protein
MKAIVRCLVALSLVAGLAGQADAASQQRKERLKAGQASKTYAAKARGTRQPASSDTASDYYEHVLDKVPFGSKRWWSIYDEQKGTPN